MAEQEYCPTCFSEIGEWVDDPILTPLGLSGEDYEGITLPKFIHITELQDYYRNLEIQTGIEDPTTFTSVDIFLHIHIEELRISIEKLLDNQGSTLEDYFKYDKYGNETGLTKLEWTDVDRDNGENYPLLPTKMLIKAIHIEELRIGMLLEDFWEETWNSIEGNPTETKNIIAYAENHFLGKNAAINLDTIADYDWLGNLSLSARCDTHAHTAPPSHPSFYSKVMGSKEILGADNKSYKLNSEITTSVYKSSPGAPASVFSTGSALTLAFPTATLRVNTSISIIENLQIITVGSVSDLISGSFYTDQYNYANSKANLKLALTLRHPIQISNGELNYFYKPTGSSKTPASKFVVVDWFNMTRNLYTDIENYLNNTAWLIDKDPTKYSIVQIQIIYYNSSYIITTEDDTQKIAISNLNLTLDNIKIG